MCPYYLIFIEVIDWNLHSIVSWPIKKLLVQINQSSCLFCFCHNFFNRGKEANIYEVKLRRVRSQIPYADTGLFYFSSIIFKNITVSLKKQLFRKKCYSWGRTRLPKKVRRFTVAYKCPLSDKCCGREQFLL